MVLIRVRDDWPADRERLDYELDGKRGTLRIGRGRDAWIKIDSRIAVDSARFETKEEKTVVKEVIVEELVVEKVKKVVKKKVVKKKGIKERIKEIAEDLLDDGKLNHSNNVKKKSPGRPKKKK